MSHIKLFLKDSKTTLLFNTVEEKKRYVQIFLKQKKVKYVATEVATKPEEYYSPYELQVLEAWAAEQSTTYSPDTSVQETVSILRSRLKKKGIDYRCSTRTKRSLAEDDLFLQDGILYESFCDENLDYEISDIVNRFNYASSYHQGTYKWVQPHLHVPFIKKDWNIQYNIYGDIKSLHHQYFKPVSSTCYFALSTATHITVENDARAWCYYYASSPLVRDVAIWAITFFGGNVSEAWRFRSFRAKIHQLVVVERPELVRSLKACGFWESLTQVAKFLSNHGVSTAKDIKNFLTFIPNVWVKGRSLYSCYQPNLALVKVVACTDNYTNAPMWCKKLLCTQTINALHNGKSNWEEKRHGDIWRSVIPACRVWQLDSSVPLKYAKRLAKMPYLSRVAGVLAHRELNTWANKYSYTQEQFWQTFLEYKKWSKIDLLTHLRGNVEIPLSFFEEEISPIINFSKYTALQLVSGINSKLSKQAREILASYIATKSDTSFLKGFKYSVFEEIVGEYENTCYIYEDWFPHSAVVVTVLFGKQWRIWLDKCYKSHHDSFHDCSFWLSMNRTKGLSDYLLRYVSTHYLADLALICKNVTADHDLSLAPRKLAALIRQEICEYRYDKNNPDAVEFAVESLRHNVSKTDFEGYLPRYLDSLATPTLPSMAVKCGNLTGYFLPRNDPRGLYLGNYTNCCQHPAGVGSSCAWLGQTRENSGFFVVEDQNKDIIAQSWYWYTDKGLCFDNVESKGLGRNTEAVQNIYIAISKRLDLFPVVNLGIGTSDIETDIWEKVSPIDIPFVDAYTDARRQVRLATHNTTPRDVEKLSVIIRQGYDSDLPVAESIARECFSSIYMQTVAVPDDPAYIVSYVIDHPQAGVVGYLVADDFEREVCDLAVLPAYRRYTVKLITTFLAAHSGQWTADLTPDSLKLLRHMHRKGMLLLEETGLYGECGASVQITTT